METRIDYSRGILNDFLNRWTIDTVQALTLEEYVGLRNTDTFCQWIETRTRVLGSIKGIGSIKFGIYKRRDPSKRPKNYRNDDQYSWLPYYGEDRVTAFENIKNEILQVIRFATTGEFQFIDRLHLPKFFKWKIAYLYSNERLIPIFKKEVLEKIARHFGINLTRQTSSSEIQQVMIAHKPANQDIYEYSEYLYDTFGRDNTKRITPTRRHSRKATERKNLLPQVRTVATTYIADYKHDKLQEALKAKLVSVYGSSAVKLEENYVDIKLVLDESVTFYEVKSASFASDCIRQALGQVLCYTFYDLDDKIKKVRVVGQYAPNDNEKEFIQYLKNNLQIDFDYESVSIAET